ncbi:MAG: KTSC domain-containing protein [Acidobacteriota bacterium]
MSRQPARRTVVESSALAAITYGSDATLETEFRRGAIYRYGAVPEVVFQGLIAATSKGAYFNRHVRTRFRYRRVG